MGAAESEVGGLSPAGSAADYVSGTTGNAEVRMRVSCTTRTGSFTTRGEVLRLSVTP